MSKFDKAGSSEATFADVKEKTAAKAMTFKMVDVKHLMRCMYNKEDVSYTEDIEESIDELGFIDPIEVMLIDRDVTSGKKLKCLESVSGDHRYLILSRHRRFEAAVKKGIKEIPCVQINKKFDTDAEIENYVLVANCHRNNLRDPLLYYKRYTAHREYFNANQPKMSISDIDKAIAVRMGMSERTIRRFRTLDGNIIEPLFDMVRREEIALSGLDGMATLTSEQQTELYGTFRAILDERSKNGEDREISRDEANRIISEYKSGSDLLPDNTGTSTSNDKPEELQNVTELATVASGGNSHMPVKTDMQLTPSDDVDYNDAAETCAFEGTGKKAMADIDCEQRGTHGNHKALLNLLDKLSDVRGTHGCDWSSLKNEDEAADTAQIVANAVMDLIDEIKSITNIYQLADKRYEVFSSIANAAK